MRLSEELLNGLTSLQECRMLHRECAAGRESLRCTLHFGVGSILLQNPLAFLPKDDSVALMRFAVEAIDDGAAQSRPR